MKHSNFEYGKVMPSNLNPMAWDTVLESVNDRLGQHQPTGPSTPVWTCWKQSQASGKKFFLTLGTASVLATAISVAAHAEIMSVNQEVDLIASTLDIDGDELPDLSCTSDVVSDGFAVNGEVSCIDINGEIVEVGDGICDLPKRDDEPVNDDAQTDTQVCPAGAAKSLAIKTSGDRNAWVKMVMDADRLVAKTVEWGYERCVGFPIEVGQTTGEVTCPPTDAETTTEGGTGVDLPPPPPILPAELTSQIDSSGNVRLCWKDNSNNETGFKVSRDGKLIGMTAANLTCYTDTGLPPLASKVTYTVVATNGAGDSPPATTEQPIVNTHLGQEAMLFIAVDGAGSGKITTSPGVISCEVSNCHDDPNDSLVPKCNPQKCAESVDIGKTVTLTPHADRGSFFSSWGGHQDCVDGQVTMTNSKLCIAFFRQNGLNDRLRPPEETRISQVCEGVVFDSEGKDQSTSAQFESRVLVNGVDVATVKTTDQVDILGYIRIDSQHLSLLADIFAYASHQATVREKPSYWMIENDKFLPWDENPAHLVPFRKEVLSHGELSVKVYHGKMPSSGIVKFHLGYRLEDGTVVCSSRPTEINVEK